MGCPKCGVNEALKAMKKGVLMFRPCADCTVVYKRRSPATRTMMASSTSIGELISDVKENTEWMPSYGGSFR